MTTYAFPTIIGGLIKGTITSKRGGIVVQVISFTNQYDQTAYLCRVVRDYRGLRYGGREFTAGPGADLASTVEVAHKIINGTW